MPHRGMEACSPQSRWGSPRRLNVGVRRPLNQDQRGTREELLHRGLGRDGRTSGQGAGRMPPAERDTSGPDNDRESHGFADPGPRVPGYVAFGACRGAVQAGRTPRTDPLALLVTHRCVQAPWRTGGFVARARTSGGSLCSRAVGKHRHSEAGRPNAVIRWAASNAVMRARWSPSMSSKEIANGR